MQAWEENQMSMVDKGDRNTVSMKDLDPSYDTKDGKEQALDRIENKLDEVNKNLKEIITLLTAIKNKRSGRTISV